VVRGSWFVVPAARIVKFIFAMTARRYEDLDAWQLADELKREVYALIASGPVVRDVKFCDQIRDSAASNARNIAEGFGRFRP